MPKKTVLFDAGPILDANKTGVGYYVSHLVNSLQAYHADQLSLTGYYFNFLHRKPDKAKAAPPGIKLREIRFAPGKLLSLCRRFGFQPPLEAFIRKPADVVLFTNYVALPRLHKNKAALIIYDAGFLDVPEYTQDVNLRYLKRFCPPSIKKADIIITISEFTKQRLEHHFPGLKAEIIVTPIPPPELKTAESALSPRLESLGVKSKKYILSVGTLEPRKNLVNLIKAYGLLSEKLRAEYSLVLAGGKGWKDQPILNELDRQRSNGISIITTGYVTDEEKSALYANSACFVLASHYEGFGMPILEAMQYGVLPLLSDIPVFHEVAGKAAIYFDKDNPTAIANSLKSGLSDQALISRITEAAPSQLGKFSWRQNADKIYRALV